MSTDRTLAFSLAINEALHQMMESDPSVFLIGQGVKSPWYVGNTAQGLLERFGEARVIDTPVSENAMTGAAVGPRWPGCGPSPSIPAWISCSTRSTRSSTRRRTGTT